MHSDFSSDEEKAKYLFTHFETLLAKGADQRLSPSGKMCVKISSKFDSVFVGGAGRNHLEEVPEFDSKKVALVKKAQSVLRSMAEHTGTGDQPHLDGFTFPEKAVG